MKPMTSLLDPTLDVVFKLLFADERNRELLSALLTAVLAPPEPITDVEVLNPETPRETVIEKGAVLDVRARLADGTQTHVEMQAARHPGLRQRALYYWARLYTSQLVRGDHYVELAPTVGVFLLSFAELPTAGYHSVFRLMEADEQVVLADDLVIHVLELPKRPSGPPAAGEPAVLRWCRFFGARSEEELEQLATMDPHLRQAKDALERLSADPAAQELARERELAAWNYERGLRLARSEGRAEGREEGRAQGREEGLEVGLAKGERLLLRRLLLRKFGELSPAAEARLEQGSEIELNRWAEQLLTATSIDEALS
jgi:predicted transposase/invertase (TIGR01784 family)